MNRFRDKVVIITGAASGMGFATAERLAQEDAKLVLVDIDHEALDRAAARLGSADVIVVPTDVSHEEQVRAYVGKTLDRHGRIDGFFNNAGIEGRNGIPTEEFGADAFRRVLSVNLDGVFFGLAEVLKVMRTQRSGAIVNTASIGGIRGIGNQAGYAASKHGVVGLTRNAAVEYGKYGIQINAIAPGAIVTALMERALRDIAGEDWLSAGEKFLASNPMPRFGKPEEVAALTAFLLSGEAPFLTGTVIPIDGGQACKV